MLLHTEYLIKSSTNETTGTLSSESSQIISPLFLATLCSISLRIFNRVLYFSLIEDVTSPNDANCLTSVKVVSITSVALSILTVNKVLSNTSLTLPKASKSFF